MTKGNQSPRGEVDSYRECGVCVVPAQMPMSKLCLSTVAKGNLVHRALNLSVSLTVQFASLTC